MSQKIEAIYENGVLQPLEPLNLTERQRVSVIVDAGLDEDWIDHDAIEWAKREGDPTISLDEVRQRLAKISGSFSDFVIAERGEY